MQKRGIGLAFVAYLLGLVYMTASVVSMDQVDGLIFFLLALSGAGLFALSFYLLRRGLERVLRKEIRREMRKE